MTLPARNTRSSILTYFVLTFAISWAAAYLVAAPRLLRGEPLTQSTGVLMFPAMLAGPAIAGVLLTWVTQGSEGVGALFARMSPARIPAIWWAVLLVPPVLIL